MDAAPHGGDARRCRPGMSSWKDRATKAKSLASPTLIRDARPGAVFTVDDGSIGFPGSQEPGAGPRTEHPTRYAIIVQAHVLCTSMVPNTVLVVPCSASSRQRAGAHDFDVPDTETAFSKENIVAYVSLVQPIRKGALRVFKGDLAPATLEALRAVMLRNLGLFGQATVAAPTIAQHAEENATDDASEGTKG